MTRLALALVICVGGFFASQAYAYNCPLPPEVVRNINTRAVYVDKEGSIEDPSREAKNKRIREPITDFQNNIERIADEYYQDRSPEKLECARSYIEKWATERALLDGKVSGQGELVRFWTAGAVGVAMLKLGLNEKNSPASVREWFQSLGEEIEEYVDQREVKNNLYYWSGYSLGVVGRVLNNQSYQKKSHEIFLLALDSIQPDGTLPIELRRGRKASAYHAFAAQAIFGLALINNADFQELDKGSFGKLVDLLQTITGDPGYLAAKAGAQQRHIAKQQWLPVYERLVATKGVFPKADNSHCGQIPYLGGNLCNFASLHSAISR